MTCWGWPTTCAVSGGATPVTTKGTSPGTRPRTAGDPGSRPGSAALREACRDFAAILWQEVLRTVERSLIPRGAGVAGRAIYAGVALEALARQLAGQTGLADFVYRTLAGAESRQQPGDRGRPSAAGKETGFS